MFSLFLLTGCSGEKKEIKKNKIVTSNWIGYAPILYAYEIGDLEKLNIELIVSSSLQSSVLMYKKNKLDGICSTKIEIDYINQSENKSLHITPISIFNRSYGGDVILSNIKKEQLYSNNYKNIDVFLEKDSINEVIFKAFKKMVNLDTNYTINYLDQYNLSKLNYTNNTNKVKLLVTYEPYATKLKQKGFHLIESTKNDKILVFDFLSVNNNSFTKTQIKKLQNIINKSINTLQNNPKKVFESIKFYYDDITYEEFNTLLTEIKLFSKERKDIFLSLIKKEKICNKQNYLKEQ